MAQQTVTTGYGTDGRIASAGFMHNGEGQHFTYSYLPGSGLLQQLAMPNGVTLTQAYEPRRDLLTEMAYCKDGTTLAARSYRYDNLGRPTTRNIRRDSSVRQDCFGYNSRNELTDAQLGLKAYRYDYDNIGNRKAVQGETKAVYTTNALNQYTRIGSSDGATHFAPAYDADGNQTLVKTDTGVWHVEYNAENRPVAFTRTEGNVTTRVTCTYDTMGRRATKKVESNGETTLHQRYLYRGYLQIAACDLSTEGTPTLWHILWDPTQHIATRPLAIRKDGTWYTYGWDLTKNICEVYGQSGYLRTLYTYTPYGVVTSEGDVSQPIQWNSEFADDELKVIYYNFRYYNPLSGRWGTRDIINSRKSLYRDYIAFFNSPSFKYDRIGLNVYAIDGTNYDAENNTNQETNVHKFYKSCNSGEKPYYIGGPGSDDPDIGLDDAFGIGFQAIEKTVYKKICSDFCNNRSITINLIGWSRGAVIANNVARLLNEKGCCCKSKLVIHTKIWKRAPKRKPCKAICLDRVRPIAVNFLGLFDPVDMHMPNSKPDIPNNVKNVKIIVKTTEQIIYPTHTPSNAPVDPTPNAGGIPSDHGDIGGTSSNDNPALQNMKEAAKEAGVDLK